jgi:metallo-beta-lactamase family protein
MVEQISNAFHDTIAGGGTVLVPAFAVGRAQLITLLLRDAMWRGKLPEVPIHIDSPMAVDATKIYSRHLEDGTLDPHLGDGESLFPRRVRFHRTVQESKQLNEMAGPRIIIASSGMLTGGRVVHHLHRLLPDPKNLLLLVGYQAAGTRGRALLEGAKTLRMHGQEIAVRASFIQINGLSAHADADELVRWIGSAPRKPGRVFVTHGEPPATDAFAKRLREELNLTVNVPKLDQGFEL